jgi:hypothetical protein
METTSLILTIIVLLFAVYIVAMNWGCVIVSLRNKRRGIDRHHSTVPVVSFILVAIAHLIYPKPNKNWMFIIPLVDIANWSLLALPIVLFRRSGKTNIEPGAPASGGPRRSSGDSGDC